MALDTSPARTLNSHESDRNSRARPRRWSCGQSSVIRTRLGSLPLTPCWDGILPARTKALYLAQPLASRWPERYCQGYAREPSTIWIWDASIIQPPDQGKRRLSILLSM